MNATVAAIPSDEDDDLSGGEIVGIVIGVLFAFIILLILLIALLLIL